MTFALKRRVVVAVLLLTSSRRVHADTFTVPLSLHEQSTSSGSYATANFDFGTTFSQISSIKLQLLIPGGFRFVAVSTGNSTYLSWLDAALYGPEATEDQLCFFCGFGAPPPAPVPFLGQPVTLIPPGIASDVNFMPPMSPNGDVIWPDFILAGKGQLLIAAVGQQTIDPLVPGIPSSTTRGSSVGTEWDASAQPHNRGHANSRTNHRSAFGCRTCLVRNSTNSLILANHAKSRSSNKINASSIATAEYSTQ